MNMKNVSKTFSQAFSPPLGASASSSSSAFVTVIFLMLFVVVSLVLNSISMSLLCGSKSERAASVCPWAREHVLNERRDPGQNESVQSDRSGWMLKEGRSGDTIHFHYMFCRVCCGRALPPFKPNTDREPWPPETSQRPSQGDPYRTTPKWD